MGKRLPPIRSQLAVVRSQLLLAALGMTAITLGVAGLSAYHIVARNLYSRLDQSLLTLAEAASHSLPEMTELEADLGEWEEHRFETEQAEGPESGQRVDDPDERASSDQAKAPRERRDSHPYLDKDGDLDLPWRELRQANQSIEWFDPEGHELYHAGAQNPNAPLLPQAEPPWSKGYRLLTVPVYSDRQGAGPAGYVRVMASTAEIEEDLRQLRWGLIWGGLVALSGCGLGSWGLMRLAMRPVEASFERLRQFTADASHELRSPLTVIQTSVAVMQSHPKRIDPADVKKVDAIASATRQMGRLVEDLLLLARLDNTPTADLTLIPLDSLLEDLADLYADRADQIPLMLTTRLTAGGLVQGNASQLQRLFTNLLDNALKYTPPGGTITLSSHRQDNMVLVQVEDTGIGIEPGHLPKVFDRFWRADPVRSHRDGSGLGLAIAQRIAQAHQGSLMLTSQLGEGTTALVRLALVRR